MPIHLIPHPRLYIGSEQYSQLRTPPESDLLMAAAERVRTQARKLLVDSAIDVDPTAHNWHLLRARIMQKHIFALLVEYKRTGDVTFRSAILTRVRQMAGWEYWSWLAWRANESAPDAIFDLSYGENCTTLAVAFDALRPELNDEETSLFVDTAVQRGLNPYLISIEKDNRVWWHKKPDSNWNTVCNGGAGMLALALADEFPEAPRVLDLVEAGVKPYFELLQDDGAWPEGIGYWGYGMRYAFMYLLSHERATSEKHPLLERPQTQATLLFPLLFTPNGVPCSFGDVNRFFVLPFHLAIAERYGRWDIIQEVEQRMARENNENSPWPNDAELLLLHPRSRMQKSQSPGEWPRCALMKGLEWGYVADRMPRPAFYASLRGGTTNAPHVHNDLMSFFCVVNDETLIDNVPVDDYYDTTFTPRRFELYETSASSKNTIFINGVSTANPATVKTRMISDGDFDGFVIDATQAMGPSRFSLAALYCGRALVMLQKKALLLIDRVVTQHAALFESRLHTFSKAAFKVDEVQIQGKRERLHLAFAADQPFILRQATGIPSSPTREPDTMIRLVSQKKETAMTLCCLLTPNGTGGIKIQQTGPGATILVSIKGGPELQIRMEQFFDQ